MPNNDSSTPSQWVRPLGACERMYAYGGHFKTFSIVEFALLESQKPFDKSEIMRAAQLWYRHTSLLQVCVRRRCTSLWFHQLPKTQDIDFQVVEEDPEEVIVAMQNTTYDMKNGPLWRARVVLLSNESSIKSNVFVSQYETSPEGMVAQKNMKSNRAMFVLGIQHVVTDGTTNFILARNFVKILNRIMSGNDTNLEVIPVSTFTADALRPSAFWLLLTLLWSKLCWGVYGNFGNRKITFSGKMPIPTKHEQWPSRFVRSELDEATTRHLIIKCKQENTTVHSCVTTAANIAYLEMVNSETSNSFDSLDIYYVNNVNVRRYYPEDCKQILGCHMSFQEQTAIVTSNDKENFWQIARKSKKKLHTDLKNKLPLKILPILPMVKLELAVNSLAKRSDFSDVTDYHYATSNMGDITHYFDASEVSEPVKVVDIFYSTAADKATNRLTLLFHTFRGRLHVACDYFTNKIGERQIKKILDGTIQILQNLCKEEISVE